MKNLFAIAAIVLGTVVFSACGGKTDTTESSDTTATTTEATVDTATTTDTAATTVDTAAHDTTAH
ncbi:hypothetical protein [Xanthocytophaga agilis]|uniref:Entericidin n=1 Tax=Xanthocytophaga agilis TaxID=3048010 RepID=A0AAE3R4M0_9BACT|nr:hypothetical protein [Xanthocytophaga agilis]MDJ1503831.1 hypothetical protein [Xanthocytophaga agilis]